MDRYHPGWARFIALWIDGFIVSVLSNVFGLLMRLELGVIIDLPLAIAHACIGVAYSVYMHGRFGQTLGKFFVRVRVVGLDGQRISYEQAVMREIVPLLVLPVSIWLSIYVVLYREYPVAATYLWAYWLCLIWSLLEMATMLFNEQRRAIHDFIAKTVVVRVP